MPRPDRSRAALLDSAALLFRRQGYAATGVNQILETADVKAGSLYHHFPDGKQALAAAGVDSAGGGIERLLDRPAHRAAGSRSARRLPDRTDRHRVRERQPPGA